MILYYCIIQTVSFAIAICYSSVQLFQPRPWPGRTNSCASWPVCSRTGSPWLSPPPTWVGKNITSNHKYKSKTNQNNLKVPAVLLPTQPPTRTRWPARAASATLRPSTYGKHRDVTLTVMDTWHRFLWWNITRTLTKYTRKYQGTCLARGKVR